MSGIDENVPAGKYARKLGGVANKKGLGLPSEPEEEASSKLPLTASDALPPPKKSYDRRRAEKEKLIREFWGQVHSQEK